MTSASTRPRLVLAGVLVAAGVLGGSAVAAGASTPSPSPSPSASAGAATVRPAGAPETGGRPTATDRATDEAARSAEQDQRKAARTAARAQRKAARTAAQAQRRAGRSTAEDQRGAGRPAAPAGPAFVCDPARSHGQNVSAYARSLPQGPGRGRLVSQAARSDCGKPSVDD